MMIRQLMVRLVGQVALKVLNFKFIIQETWISSFYFSDLSGILGYLSVFYFMNLHSIAAESVSD